MARNAYVEDVEDVEDEWQLVTRRDESTIPAASEDEPTLRAGSEVDESIPTSNHELPICLNSSGVIETTDNGNDEVVPGDASYHLYSKADAVIDEVGIHITGSNRDAITLVKPNDATTGNESDRRPTRRLCYENINVPSGHASIDIETETDLIKWSGPMSTFPAFMETTQAAKSGTSDLFDHNTSMARERAKTTGLEIGLAEIRKSLLQAISDKDDAHVMLLLENGADANSEDTWGPALTQAIGWKNEKVIMELIARGADVNATDTWGPALTQAIRWKNEKVIMELIARGADVNATDTWGLALTQAIRCKNENVIMELIARGANVNATDTWGSVLMQAQRGGLAKTVKELLIQGTQAPPKIQTSSRFGQTTIEGVFPNGTKLDISTPDGTRQIIASGQKIIARNVSAGPGSFQFIGDAASLDAYLEERRNMN